MPAAKDGKLAIAIDEDDEPSRVDKHGEVMLSHNPLGMLDEMLPREHS